jgi:predicted transcriptional regulator of viral defense system
LRRVHRGVYAVGGAVLPREGRWLAAVLACGPRAALSHVGAAVHWNLLNYEPPLPEVTAPAPRKGVPGIRLHRPHSLDAHDTTNHQGILTTTLARTLLDIAVHVPSHHPSERWRRPSACSSMTTEPSAKRSHEPTATAGPSG